MKNLKRYLAVLVAVAVLLTAIVPAFAAGSYTYGQQAETLNKLNLYAGISTTGFDPDLGTALDRQTGVSMLVKIFGKEDAAKALSADEVKSALSKFSDADQIDSWAKPFVALAVKTNMVKGNPDGTFGPKAGLLGKAYCTMILRNLGYEPNYDAAAAELADVGGLSAVEAVKFANKQLIKDDLVGISYSALQAEDKNGVTLMGKLVAEKVVDETKAIDSGVYPEGKYAKEEGAKIAAAEAAVSAFEKITKSTDAPALKKAAAEAVALVSDKTALAAFAARLIKAEAAVEALKVEEAVQADAEKAVKAYEDKVVEAYAQIAEAAKLEDAAKAAVAKVTNATAKAAFDARITSKKEEIDFNAPKISPAKVSFDASSLKRLIIKFDKDMDTTTLNATNIQIFNSAGTNIMNGSSVPGTNEYFRNEFSQVIDGSLKEYSAVYNHGVTVGQSDVLKVVINNVKDANGVVMPKSEQYVTVKDIDAPTVKSVTITPSKKIQFNFSESMRIYGSTNQDTNYTVTDVTNTKTSSGANAEGFQLKVDGKLIYAGFKSYAYFGSVIVRPGTALTEGKHTIELSDAKDYAGFKMEPFKTEVEVVYDKIVPVATGAEVLNATQVKVSFNETVTATGSFSVKDVTSSTELYTGGSVAVDSNDNKNLIITLGTRFTANAMLGVVVVVDAVQDSSGNASTKYTFNTVLSDDTSKISVKSATIQDNNKLRIVFSEAPKADFAGATLKLYSAGKTDVLATYTGANLVAVSGQTNTYDLTMAYLDNKNSAAYDLKIEGVKDNSVRYNVMDAYTTTFVSKDVKSPAIDLALFNATTKELTVVYSEPMDAAAMNNLNNYYVGVAGAVYAHVAVGSTADAKINSVSADGMTVKVYIPNAGITVGCVAVLLQKDMSGKAFSGTGSALSAPKNMDVSYPEFTADELKVTVTGKRTVVVKIDTTGTNHAHKFTSVDASAFKFKTGVGEATYDRLTELAVVDYAVAEDGSTVTLTLINDLSNDAKYYNSGLSRYEDVYMYISNVNVKDQFDMPATVVSGSAIVAVDKIAAVQSAPTKAAADKISVPFSENIKVVNPALAGALAGAFTVKVDGATLMPIVDYTVAINGKNVEITIVKAIGSEKTVSVCLVAPQYLTDIAGNAVVAAAEASVEGITK